MLFGRKRNREDEDNGHNVGGMKMPEEVRVSDIPDRMNELFPDFRILQAWAEDGRIHAVAYRRCIEFDFWMERDEALSMWRWESVVPLQRRLEEVWHLKKETLMTAMRIAGESDNTCMVMRCLTKDDKGYLVDNLMMKEDDNDIGADLRSENGSAQEEG